WWPCNSSIRGKRCCSEGPCHQCPCDLPSRRPASARVGNDPWPTDRRSLDVSLAYVQNFAISLDGFGTGEGLSRDRPFGHAEERLHGWMFETRWWREQG